VYYLRASFFSRDRILLFGVCGYCALRAGESFTKPRDGRVTSGASGTCSHASVLEKQSFRFVHVNFYININIRTFEHLQGEEFDSSYNRGEPTKFAPNQVIKGWTEAMQLMSEGDKWELVIPSELAYGDRAMGPQITPGSVLVFEMEIVKVGA